MAPASLPWALLAPTMLACAAAIPLGAELTQLSGLHTSGALDDAEFRLAKAKLLGQGGTQGPSSSSIAADYGPLDVRTFGAWSTGLLLLCKLSGSGLPSQEGFPLRRTGRTTADFSIK